MIHEHPVKDIPSEIKHEFATKKCFKYNLPHNIVNNTSVTVVDKLHSQSANAKYVLIEM